jgi:hypothetical protein
VVSCAKVSFDKRSFQSAAELIDLKNEPEALPSVVDKTLQDGIIADVSVPIKFPLT